MLTVETGSGSLETGTETWALSATVLVPAICSEPIACGRRLSIPSHIQGTGAAALGALLALSHDQESASKRCVLALGNP